MTIVFEGVVLDPGGGPADGAVVVTSEGGKAVTDRNGRYRLEAVVPVPARSVRITAVGQGRGNLVASANVTVGHSLGATGVDALRLALGSTCQPSWLPTFGGLRGSDGGFLALTVFDDGSGPALYGGGAFEIVDGVVAHGVIRWDGSRWTDLEGGMGGSFVSVHSLEVYDDGNGPALYAGGAFTTAGSVAANRIARWDGSSWTPLGTGVDDTVFAMEVFDDGNGPALFVGGRFTTAGGSPASHVARWDGTNWSAVGSGTDDQVRVLLTHDEGAGSALYAGGFFQLAGGVAAGRIARWDGSTWSAVGTGMNNQVRALAVYDDGTGSALYAGGTFTTADGLTARRIAMWDGVSWSEVGGGLTGVSPLYVKCFSLTVHDDGRGAALYVGGIFQSVGNETDVHLARWDGASWEALRGLRGVQALCPYDDGTGPSLYAGLEDEDPSSIALKDRVFRWDTAAWAPLDDQVYGLNDQVLALVVFDDGDGPALCAGGDFTLVDGTPVGRVAKWDGGAWEPLGSGVEGVINVVRALAVHDDGTGSALYAAGLFDSAGGTQAPGIARWDGASWAPVVGGSLDPVGPVDSLAVYDLASGPRLYAGGGFSAGGGPVSTRVAQWDGTGWVGLGGPLDGTVHALAGFDDGTGPKLVAGGGFTHASGVVVNRIACWDGTSWAPLGSGVGTSSSFVRSLLAYDDGTGPVLVVGGLFAQASGVSVGNVARWDGAVWSALGLGLPSSTVNALAVFDDGSGRALHAAWLHGVERWDGATWSPLGGGFSLPAFALVTYDSGGGSALYAGGRFEQALDSGDSFLAKWGCDVTPPSISCPRSVNVIDRSPAMPGEVVFYEATAIDDHDRTPELVCTPPSGSFFPFGTTAVTCTATDAAGNQSTRQFPVTVGQKVQQVSF